MGDFGSPPFCALTIFTSCRFARYSALFQGKAKTIFTADKKMVQITGSALLPGDICPELPVISGGTATIFGVKRKIQEARKARNPDGTVNYTEVLLI
jgi:hypothetical protein